MCHLAIASDDEGIFWDELIAEAVADNLVNTVLVPDDGDPFTHEVNRITLGPIVFPLLPLKPYTVLARGGYYDPVLVTPNNLLEHYVVHGEDTEDFRGEITVVLAVSPNPPIYGDPVTYTVTVMNVGKFSVTGLTASYQINPLVAAAVPVDGIMLAGSHLSPALQTSGVLALTPTTLAPGQVATGILVKSAEDQAGTYLFSVTVVGNALVAGDTTGRADLEITPLGTDELDPNATNPTVEKTPNVSEVQPGDELVWTITVRNGSTSAFQNVVLEDNVPDVLTINSVTLSAGASVTEGQVVTASIGNMAPGATSTITINTTVSPDVPVPSSILNSACATHTGGGQVCKTATVNVGPGVDTLPSTGNGIWSRSGFIGGALW
jgi:uncharacterized repeat protein (TIGR01451 family)